MAFSSYIGCSISRSHSQGQVLSEQTCWQHWEGTVFHRALPFPPTREIIQDTQQQVIAGVIKGLVSLYVVFSQNAWLWRTTLLFIRISVIWKRVALMHIISLLFLSSFIPLCSINLLFMLCLPQRSSPHHVREHLTQRTVLCFLPMGTWCPEEFQYYTVGKSVVTSVVALD